MAVTGYRESMSGDGQSTALEVGGPVRLSLTGTFGGGTAQLQTKDPGGNWVDVANGSFTAVTDTLFDFPLEANNEVRVDLSGSTTPALVVWIQAHRGDFH